MDNADGNDSNLYSAKVSVKSKSWKHLNVFFSTWNECAGFYFSPFLNVNCKGQVLEDLF
uniref:Uncharacterized protein n=1 Tax=Anguilla anguilla TaxID=7936 RepID=A0A0E9X5B0_ANGAN